MNLERQRELFCSTGFDIDKSLFAITGIVSELSTAEVNEADGIVDVHASGQAFFSTVTERRVRDGHDYLDLSANLKLSGVPGSFGGVSGGGLWQIGLSKEMGEIIWDCKRRFAGVAFWQSTVSEGRRVIRCHGPKSLFEAMWPTIQKSGTSSVS